MHFDWLAWSNPVAVWWVFLLAVSTANISLWLVLHRHVRQRARARRFGPFRIELMVLLSAAYVFGCAFRSVLPRADVQRICLFDTWFFERPGGAIGRDGCGDLLRYRMGHRPLPACAADEIGYCQKHLDHDRSTDRGRRVLLVVLGDHRTSYLGNTIENSIWMLTFLLIAVALLRLLERVPRRRSACDRHSGCRHCRISGLPRRR